MSCVGVLLINLYLIHMAKPIYSIVGPTASGKTQLGVDLALRVGGEVINCDSVQIYQGIEIATAKPTEEEKRCVPHHLIAYVPPEVNYTAADWARDAAEKIAEIESRGNIPILVGGSGFYLRTIRTPLFESPKTDDSLRERFRAIQAKYGAPYLHKMLRRLDPASAEKLFPNDYVRVIRALEVYFQTGKPISEQQPNRIDPPEFAARIKVFVLNPTREVLYAKIDRRTAQHFEAGLVDEVKNLRAGGLRDDTNALGSHAYRRVCEYLRGERDMDSAIEQSARDVRHYAKRQITWFKREEGVIWLDGFGDEPEIFDRLLSEIE